MSVVPSAPPPAGPRPSVREWREMLQSATSVGAVNAIMQDYILILQFVLGELPRDCREALGGDLDVQATAVTLLHAELHFQGSEEARELLHEAAHMFASAAVRIVQLQPHPA